MSNTIIRALVLGAAAYAATTTSAEPLKVVASFSIIADLASNVGGDRVRITTLVGPDGDVHAFEPRPADAAALSAADVVLVNGLGFEGFVPRLAEASGTKAAIVELAKGATTIGGDDSHHAVDPHAFQSIPNAEIYVKNIAEAFCAADIDNCDAYRANAAAYDARLAELDAEIRETIGSLPENRRTIITSHDAFGYFASTYGVVFLAPEGVSTDAEASASDVARLITQVRDAKATAVFVENITNTGLIQQIASETGLKVGGTLYSDALSDASGPAATYIDMMRHNVRTIRDAVYGS